MEESFRFPRPAFGYLKGVAIVLMFVHHFFGFPSEYPEIPVHTFYLLSSYAGAVVENSTRICIGIFAFLSGYAAGIRPNGFSFRYGLKKSVSLLLRYWLILFGIFLPLAVKLSGYEPTLAKLVLNAFALRGEIVTFAWYVYFFLFAMVALPLFLRCFPAGGLTGLLVPILLCVGISEYFSSIQIRFVSLSSAAAQCFSLFPVLWCGYWCAKNHVFSHLQAWLPVKSAALGAGGFFAVLVCRVFFHDLGQLDLDVLYAPLAVYFLVSAFQCCSEKNPLLPTLSFLGKHSCNLWFLHALFFSPYMNGFFLRIVCLPKLPLLILLFAFLLCLPVSMGIEFLLQKLRSLFVPKNHVLRT